MIEMQLLRESSVIALNCNGEDSALTFILNQQNLAVVCDQEGHPFASVDDAVDEVLGLLFAYPA
ncbi:MAG: hypothetical protein ABSA48_07890 [Terracidiphilus sp.]|jgi:hypothetical protein